MSVWQSCSERICSLTHRFLPSFANTTFPSLPPERRALEREEVEQGKRSGGKLGDVALEVQEEDEWNEGKGEQETLTLEVTSGAGSLRALPLFGNFEAARRLVSEMGERAFVNGNGFGHAQAVRETVETVAGQLVLGVVLGHVAKKVYAAVFPH